MDLKENKNNINEDINIIDSSQTNQIQEAIIDLPKLSTQSEVKNSDVILAILEICTYNKKYNYDCSNNTKAFWERVVNEDILKKIFKNFKSETLRKYWKIIRLSGNNNKFIDTVKSNEKFINNPVFKLLPIINAISSFVKSEENNFENFFISFSSKDKKPKEEKEENQNNINLIGIKRHQEESISPPPMKLKPDQDSINAMKIKEKTEEVDPKMQNMDELINKLMEISKYSREEVVNALYGTSNNFEHAYKYLQDNEKYDKYFFVQTDDYIIKNLRNKGYYIDLINQKGEDLVKEREKFLGIK